MNEPERDRWLVTFDLKHAMTESARELRSRSTKSEALLWRALRGKQLGVKFRRQQPIGNFIVDFYCSDARLVVEIDGAVHEAQQKADAERQALLESLGLRVVRCSAEAVERDLSEVVEAIRAEVARNPHP
jgi:very-short-patch-repair endonuclease